MADVKPGAVPDAPMVENVKIQGRTFVPASQTTFEQDFFVMDRMEASGIDKLVDGLDDKGDLEAFARDILLIAYRSGKIFEILAGVLVEEGKKWNADDALRNAALFKDLSDPADKEAIQGVLVGVILGFFVNADSSFKISPKSSSEGEGELPQSEVPLEAKIEVPSTSGSGES